MELFRELEAALRTPGRRLLIDELLPGPEAIPSGLPQEVPPTPVPPPDPAPEDPDPAASGPVEAGAGTPGRGEAPADLEAEIREFLADRRSRGVLDLNDPGDDPDPKAS